MTISTTSELVEAVNASGSHFFDQATMRAFNSILEPEILKGRYFVTSEEEPTGRVWDGERRWTIRSFEYRDGEIRLDTVGDFGQFRSFDEAKQALQNGELA